MLSKTVIEVVGDSTKQYNDPFKDHKGMWLRVPVTASTKNFNFSFPISAYTHRNIYRKGFRTERCRSHGTSQKAADVPSGIGKTYIVSLLCTFTQSSAALK